MEKDEKRLFLGLEAVVPWPQKLPNGRVIREAHRHATVAFLGQTNFPKLLDLLNSSPPLPFKVGLSGKVDKCLFLPKKHPRVVAWHVNMLDDALPLIAFQKKLTEWLHLHGFLPPGNERSWLPHITVARAPFQEKDWKKAFSELPLMFHTLRLYESLGNLNYVSVWEQTTLPAFEELDHIADIAFKVRGENLAQLHQHAQVALAFHFPPILDAFSESHNLENLDDIIIDLNRLISQTDTKEGCPFKAVSFHGTVTETDGVLEWEMIIDV